ncbi:MAG: oligosaccharide flippase family protein [Pontixanthobacter sp.]
MGLFLQTRARLLGQIGWVGSGFVTQQVLRLATSVALAWLLAPALLGTMLLINVLRTGAELLTDVGISQSIINNKRGEDPNFLNTAWTMKIVRGVLLCAIGLAATFPLADLYDDPRFMVLLPVTAGIFIISGLGSPARSVLQRRLEVKKLAQLDIGLAVSNFIVHVGLAMITPTIWALIGALWIGNALSAIISFFLIKGHRHRLQFERAAAGEIFRFGKWIFFASLVFFFASNFDRLYFAEAIPFAVLGIYGIARTFSEAIMQVFQRLGAMLVFPKVSTSSLRGAQLRASILPLRRLVLLASAAALAVAVTFADVFIMVAYDDRYLSAGIFLTILLVGTWFGILATLADAIMMGVGKPSIIASSNFAKLIAIVVSLPLLLPTYGLIAALMAFSAAEAVRYGMLVWQKRTVGLGFTRQDIMATMTFLILAVLLREATGLVGLTTGVSGWIEAARMAQI